MENIGRTLAEPFAFPARKLQEGCDALLEARPWWLRWEDEVEDIITPLLPRFKKARNGITDRFKREAILRELEHIKDLHPGLVSSVKANRWNPRFLTISARVEENIQDVEPVVDELWNRGWRITDTSDSYNSRHFKMEHPDLDRMKVTVIAIIGDQAQCEVIRHKKSYETTKYELVCEGEAELRGLA